MNKISELLKDGVITIEEVLEYAQQHMDAVDAFDDAQIDKYYQEEHNNNAPEEDYGYAQNDEGEWECSEGTLHPNSQQECDCYKYKDDEPTHYMTEEEVEWEKQRMLEEEYYDSHFNEPPSPSPNPEYLLTSTWDKLQETTVFEADSDGNMVGSDEYGCIAKRFGQDNWYSGLSAVRFFFPYKKYYQIKDFGEIDGISRILYKRYDAEIEYPKQILKQINNL